MPRRRKGCWYLIRRVPKQFRDIDGRALVEFSTGIRVADDPKGHRALKVVARLDAEMAKRWAELRDGAEPDQRKQYDAVVEKARSLRVSCLEAADVARLPATELADRVRLLANPAQQLPATVAAVLGAVKRPKVRVSQLRREFEEFADIAMTGKSERQLQRWRTGRDAAVTAFMEAIGGDRSIVDLTRDDVLAFRDAVKERAKKGEITVETANNHLGQVAAMVRELNEGRMLGLPPIFDKMRLKGAKSNQRMPYPAIFVQKHILADGLFDDVNEEAPRRLSDGGDGLPALGGLQPQRNHHRPRPCRAACEGEARRPSNEDRAIRARHSPGGRGADGHACATEGIPALPRQGRQPVRLDE